MGCNKQSHAIIISFSFFARPSVFKVGTGFGGDLAPAVVTSSRIWGHDENPAACFLCAAFSSTGCMRVQLNGFTSSPKTSLARRAA